MLLRSTAATFRLIIRPLYRKLRGVFSTSIDSYLRVVTSDECVARQFGMGSDIGYALRAFGWTNCWRVLRYLPAGPSEVLLDLGCGAGRMVCAAARMPYARVIGVDLSPKFVDLARRNVATLQKRSAPCEIVCEDATAYKIPKDVTVVFMYNPFNGAILDAALERVMESYDQFPRNLTIAYANPMDHSRISRSSRLNPTCRLQLAWRPSAEWRRTQSVQFYEVGSGNIAKILAKSVTLPSN